MKQSESIKELATALCQFQGAVEKIKKGQTNPFFKSRYASLSDILDVIRQPLFDNGISFVQFPCGKYGLETMLMHVSGEWISESYEMHPTKDDPQGAGSVITYQRRYALGAILGLNIDEDDDGNKGSEPIRPKHNEVNKPVVTPQPKQKEVLTMDHPDWQKVVDYLKGDGIMSKIQARYTMDQDTESALMDEILL